MELLYFHSGVSENIVDFLDDAFAKGAGAEGKRRAPCVIGDGDGRVIAVFEKDYLCFESG